MNKAIRNAVIVGGFGFYLGGNRNFIHTVAVLASFGFYVGNADKCWLGLMRRSNVRK